MYIHQTSRSEGTWCDGGTGRAGNFTPQTLQEGQLILPPRFPSVPKTSTTHHQFHTAKSPSPRNRRVHGLEFMGSGLFVAYRFYIRYRPVFEIPWFLHFEPSLDALCLRMS